MLIKILPQVIFLFKKKEKIPNENINKTKDTKNIGTTEKEGLHEISNDDKKNLQDLITSNIVEVENLTNKVNTNIIEEIFNENLEAIVNEIEKYK